MKKRKAILAVLLLSFSNLIFISNVLAGEKKTTFTNYYFFLQTFYQSQNLPNIMSTSNYTSFPLFESSNVIGDKTLQEAEEIPLSRNCPEGKSDDCWSYSDFFNMYIKTEEDGYSYNYYVSGSSEPVTTKYYREGNKTYYTHGLWRPSTSSEWRGGSTATLIDIYGSNAEAALSCAAFATNNTVTVEPLVSDSKNFYATIVRRNFYSSDRPIVDGFGVDWNYTLPSGNMSRCPSDDVLATHDNNLNTKVIVSPVLYKLKYDITTNKCDYDPPEVTNLACNDGLNIESTCERTTIVLPDYDTSVDVKIDQRGTVSNILTPSSLFAGGGFKFGIMYTNTISWDYVSSVSNSAVRNEVTKIMKNKLQDVDNFEAQINLSSIKFGNETVSSGLINKSCTRVGSFESGSEVTTVCTFFLPNSIMDDFTGNVTYSNSLGINYGINNKYYVPLDYGDDKYNISAVLNNMSVLKDSSAIEDSDSSRKWTGDWDITIGGDSCSIDIKSLFYPTDQLDRHNQYIYRPIDLDNPFPNRNAGVNWFEWYSSSINRERLEDSYNNLQYSITLDNQKIAEIKRYNQMQNSNRGYFDWDTMIGEESSFLREYFEDGGRR